MRSHFLFLCSAGIIALLALPPAVRGDTEAERVETAATVYRELIRTPDQGIPKYLLENCRAIVVIPHVVKAAFGFGGRYGRGIVSNRGGDGKWSPPSFVSLSGGSFGFQLGASATDMVLFVMSERGIESLIKSKFTLGGDMSAAAGPVGRTASASTDIQFKADIYSYARSKGAFAGMSVDGSVLAADRDAIRNFYGREIEPKAILFGGAVATVPPSARGFMKALP